MKTYTGSCQCGAVSYEADVDIDKTITCNCSRCGRIGAILAFVPAASFRLLSGEENLTDYQFNKNIIHHLFCKTCGVESFARGTGPDGSAMAAINVRCLDGVDPETLTPTPVDGKNA